jgi:hypothetical protein
MSHDYDQEEQFYKLGNILGALGLDEGLLEETDQPS